MFTAKKTFVVSAISVALGLSSPALAQTKPIQKDEQNLETLVITSNPFNRTVLESATPVSIIAGEDLESRVAPTLGETLKNVPGVHSSYFGPVSSSPVIRGLEGPRVKVLQNGLDVSDVSRSGPDHIVSTETSNARQIEVLRGPATLLYGSGAIGGVVNVVDDRLPTRQLEEIEGKVSYLHDSVSSEDLFNINLDGGKNGLVWHLDAFDRETENYDIPGPAELGEEDDDSGVLDNSFIDANGFNVGLGWATDSFNAAFSYGNLESEYGIPGHAHGHEDEHDDEHEGEDDHDDEHEEGEEEVVFGRLEQDRFQMLLDWKNLNGFFTDVTFKSAYTDYEHSEIEDGEVGTTFSNESFESRLWAKHKVLDGWEGVVGFDYLNSDFSALGEEAFTPASETDTWSFFVLEEKKVGDVLYQLGARYEYTEISVDNDFFEHEEHEEDEHEEEEEHHDEEIFFEDEDFSALSLSAGAIWTLDQQSTVSFNYAYSQRAPSSAEIFSNGVHIATSTYELGAGLEIELDDDHADEFEIVQSSRSVKKEVSNNFDITFHFSSEHVDASFSLFYNQIDDYLFQQDTGLFFEEDHGHDEDHDDEHEGEEDHDDEHDDEHEGEEHDEDALPVFITSQQDADIYGFEAQVDWHFNDNLRLETFADVTRAELSDGHNVPRIPPFRIGAELHWEQDSWHAEFGATHYAKQDNVAEFETVTEGYTLVNASFNYYLDVGENELVLFARGNNLTDREARVHSSFIKDDAPLPGRSIVVGARMNF